MLILFVLFTLFWVVGAKYLFIYGAFFVGYSKVFLPFKDLKGDFSLFFMVSLCFLFYQVLSTFISVFITDIGFYRLGAILHNYFVFYLFILGVSISIRFKFYFGYFVPLVFLFMVIVYLFSFFGSGGFEYSGLMESVVFVEKGYFTDSTVPRLMALSDYYNATALLIFSFFFFYMFQYWNAKIVVKFVVYLLFMSCLLFTGSRMAVLLGLALLPFVFFRSFRLLVFIYMLGVFFTIFFGYPIYSYVDSLRESSSDTRMGIYSMSLNLVMEINPITGIGYKPKPEWMKYPIGSHSSYVGYMVKNGMLGFFLWLMLLLTTMYSLFKPLLLRSKDKSLNLFCFAYVGVFFVFFLVEDLDSYEVVAFLFGGVVGTSLRCTYENKV